MNRHRKIWKTQVRNAWLLDMGVPQPPLKRRLVHVVGKGISGSAALVGRSNHIHVWRCTMATPTIHWMKGLQWEDARRELKKKGLTWSWA